MGNKAQSHEDENSGEVRNNKHTTHIYKSHRLERMPSNVHRNKKGCQVKSRISRHRTEKIGKPPRKPRNKQKGMW